MPKIVFKTTGGVETPVEVTTGTTVLQAAWDHNRFLLAARRWDFPICTLDYFYKLGFFVHPEGLMK